jgi:hypothetical protein
MSVAAWRAAELYFVDYDSETYESEVTLISEDDARITSCAVAGIPNYYQYVGYFKHSNSDEVTINGYWSNVVPAEIGINEWFGEGGRLSLEVDSQQRLHTGAAMGQIDSGTGRAVREVWHAIDDVADSHPVYRGEGALAGFGMTLTADDKAQFTYILGGTELYYATQDGEGIWSSEAVPVTLGNLESISVPQLALDRANSPVIAYELYNSEYGAYSVRLAVRDAEGTWSTLGIADDARGIYDAVTIMPSGTGRVLYRATNQVTQRFVCF